MISGPGTMVIRGMGPSSPVTRQQITPGTARRILPFARPYRLSLGLLLTATTVEACVTVTIPVLFSFLIDNGIVRHDLSLVVWISTALVCFDRLFEILDLKPLITEKPGAAALPADSHAPDIEFEDVSFRHPAAADISLASLESIALPNLESADTTWTLRKLGFRVPGGQLTALVGPSGGGKTTITHLAARTYARPDASEQDLIDACKSAQIRNLIGSLPDGLDTVAGDRGYRLSGGEKQRLAMARLILKNPPVVVLDEATAHLDSESEATLQKALKIALSGRTSLVIAHRLSTTRDADQILVIDKAGFANAVSRRNCWNKMGFTPSITARSSQAKRRRTAIDRSRATLRMQRNSKIEPSASQRYRLSPRSSAAQFMKGCKCRWNVIS
jgi:ABC-type bacteriocin/lantibiotic exporter with double-glycine peptidase domain